MRCEFCGSRIVGWIYPAERDFLACDKCHHAIQADDRKALLERVMLQPVPRTLSDAHAGKFRDRARQLHREFWETRTGPARPA